MREDNYHRINSAHIQHREQLRDIVQDIKLPEINQQQNPESNPASVQHHVQATTERTRCTDEPNRSPCLKRSVTWRYAVLILFGIIIIPRNCPGCSYTHPT